MGKHYEQPIVDMVSQTRTIQVGENKPVPPGPAENKEWMRWNNFGIALLDAQQYAASANAFERVAKLRPDYADAYTNLAIAQIQWQRYDDARPNLEKALSLAPGNARALYYRALVERNRRQYGDGYRGFAEGRGQFSAFSRCTSRTGILLLPAS